MAAFNRDAPLALTQGDPSGIGPEIALRAWHARKGGQKPFFLLGDPGHMQRAAAQLAAVSGLRIACASATPQTAAAIFDHALPVVSTGHAITGEAGRSNPQDAAGTIAAIDQGVGFIAQGLASAIVTNPITKDSLYRAGFRHPGHTEYLGELALKYFNTVCEPVMMIWSRELAVIPVTIHVSLARAINLLTPDLIARTARIAAQDLRSKFGIANPRLAISGLNPHAGENGAMGEEDQNIIAPAIAQLRKEGIDARGPLPADMLFHAAARAHYDVAICMYHDQALIPVKTLAFDTGVNTTLGLPFIRTSPDHGTAHDIAGKGLARADSLIAALELASQLACDSMAGLA